MNISRLLYMAQHWKKKLHVLNSGNSIMTLASPLLYTKLYDFLNTPETWEGKLSGWNIPNNITLYQLNRQCGLE